MTTQSSMAPGVLGNTGVEFGGTEVFAARTPASLGFWLYEYLSMNADEHCISRGKASWYESRSVDLCTWNNMVYQYAQSTFVPGLETGKLEFKHP